MNLAAWIFAGLWLATLIRLVRLEIRLINRRTESDEEDTP